MIPRATYRLQFRKEFTFEHALEIVPYLARLGISHVYASPILCAREGSPHGYDVVDHARINPELGGEDGLRRLVGRLRKHGLGLVVDIVPNHMAVGAENPWWVDVLTHGRASPHARNFDIEWDPPDSWLKNKLLLPILAMPYADTLARTEITLGLDAGKPVIAYGDHRLPIRPEDAAEIAVTSLDGFRSPAALAALLARQHYRLAWWRIAGDVINWRRFFDINDLIALRVEDESVFDQVHAKHFELYADALIDGFRVDHVDGLADPAAYCRRLRRRLAALDSRRAYIVVEKILAPGEELPSEWDVDGTTGYDFMNDVGALLHDPAGAEPLARFWATISGRPADFDTEDREARREVLTAKFDGAFEAAASAFLWRPFSGAHDATEASQQRALLRLLAELRVYRTYATGEANSPAPGRFFDAAVGRAIRRAAAHDAAAVRTVVEMLEGRSSAPSERCRVAALRFNQLAASLAAKAGEDTAYYRYGRLLSRNEVGSDPGEFAISAADFHARMQKHHSVAPLLATATHDHKRGEDTRARLAVLSEITEEWAERIASWFARNASLRDKRLDRGDEYQLYQILVGAWPLDLAWDDRDGLQRFAARIQGWQVKSLHEAKLRSSWGDPDSAYEQASADFIRRLLDPENSAEFLREIAGFVHRIAPAAALNSLTQCVLRCTAPGVPDLYQGTEFWDLSLVDPDNRNRVDFRTRAAALERGTEPVDRLADWRSGEFKQSVIARLLALRTAHAACFRLGDYRPLESRGRSAQQIVAFTRSHAGTTILIAVPRLCSRACIDAGIPHPSALFWEDSMVPLPASDSGRMWKSVLDTQQISAETGAFFCKDLFMRFPAAVLIAQ